MGRSLGQAGKRCGCCTATVRNRIGASSLIVKTKDMEEKAVPRPVPPLSALSGLEHTVDSLGKWQTEDYDGLKGRLPSWVPDQVNLDFDGDRYAVYLAVKNKRLTISQAY